MLPPMLSPYAPITAVSAERLTAAPKAWPADPPAAVSFACSDQAAPLRVKT